ncbi:MAG: holo-ACP synthase [Spirochaetota bacterium]
MIVGYGIDIMSIDRIKEAIIRFGEYFLSKVYTVEERRQAEERRKSSYEVYTAYWAAKEAVMKALGTGHRKGVRFRDIEIRHESSGKPYVLLHGRSEEYARKLHVHNIVLSMSHLHDNAIASVIFESKESERHKQSQNNGERT